MDDKSPTGRRISQRGVTFFVDHHNNKPHWDRFANSQWEPETLTILSSVILPGSTFVDCGAWVGPTTLFGANFARKVISFEPDPVAHERLTKNLNLNPDLSHVEVRQVAVSTKDGSATFYSAAFGGSASSLMPSKLEKGERKERDHSVDVKTVDAAKLEESIDFSDVSLMKIDTEGAEYEMVPRLAPILDKYRITLLLSLHPNSIANPDNPVQEQFDKLFKSLRLFSFMRGYKMFVVDKKEVLRPINFNALTSAAKRDGQIAGSYLFTTRTDIPDVVRRAHPQTLSSEREPADQIGED
jgi:FkbM family methyltransferase